jgi:hypothetical protein
MGVHSPASSGPRRAWWLIGLVAVAIGWAPTSATAQGACTPEPTTMQITYGESVTCSIGASGDTDAFLFTAAAGDVITIQGTPGSAVPCLFLYNPSAQLLGTVCDFGPAGTRAVLHATLAAGGVHTIFVGERFNATGSYGLDLQRVAPPSPNAAIIGFGQSIQAAIQPMGDTDLYAFRGVAGDSIIVGAVATLGVRAEVYDPNGIRLTGSPILLPTSGIYTIRITESFNDNLVNYTVSLQCIGVCPAGGDIDLDGMPDTCEIQFDLLRFDPADASLDPDGDSLSNLAECQGGTHPRGFFTRYLAEGAMNAFFDTRLALLNVGTSEGRVLLRFLQPGGLTLPRFELLPAGRRRTLTRADLTGLLSPDFSTVVESDQPIVVDRTMSWDANGYGSHTESSVSSPATTWYLAEGSTSADFALFYLLQNPNPTATTANVRYLRPFGQPPIDRQYPLAPNSRTTIPVDDQGPELAFTDLSAVVTAGLPIIVERAMYMTRPGQTFAAGHGSAGVTAPATSWFFAEGATGPFFDLFILLANPGSQPAEVTVDYLLLGGAVWSKSYVVPANGRFTIWVDEEQIPGGSGVRPLDNVAVSSTIRSTNGVPIIAERTMWWPSPALTASYWTEAHNSPGATATATRWAMAEGEVGGAQAAETYVLIANTSAFSGTARVTLYFEDGTSTNQTYTLLPRSRTNVAVSTQFPAAAGRRFGAMVESLGATPAQIVVERAMYTSPGGVTWAAGTNALATPLP